VGRAGQFAGYFDAKEKGFYKDAGLDVTINPEGPDVAPPQVIAGGGADVVVDWMPSALASREKGVPLVNISQTFKGSGLELTCRAETGIKKPAGLKGKTIGVWFGGNELSVPVLDVEPRPQDRRLAERRQRHQTGASTSIRFCRSKPTAFPL
jgi:ABC-type nitrate/sulfonate/bicarbonate transport system substrate-binding protein